MKKIDIKSSLLFWNLSKEFIYHYLPVIRKVSSNTVLAYQSSLNHYIDYLEQEKACYRKYISFSNLDRSFIKDYLDWMLTEKQLSAKTCNLRLTAIHSLLEYASNEHKELVPYYLSACSVNNVRTQNKPIEFFEPAQTKALLSAPNITKKTERRNQMMLVLLYDTAARVSELLSLTLNSLHLSSEIPYITIFGKGRKYRNIPLMRKTQQHLERYLKEFHIASLPDDPLFYAVAHGKRHSLSADTVDSMIKRYAKQCISVGVEMPLKPHSHMIRKTRAMDLYQSGVPLTHIQQLLGHETLATTSGFYAFATLETLTNSMEKVSCIDSDKKWRDRDVLEKIYSL